MVDDDVKDLEEEVIEIEDDELLNRWEERDVSFEDVLEEEDEGDFSIGDTALARGKSSDRWGGLSLEDEIEEEDEFDRDFSYEDEEDEEEFGDGGFSYEAVGRGSGGDLYGGNNIGSMYGGKSVNDFYGGSSNGESSYNVAGGSRNDSVSMYNTFNSGDGEANSYKVNLGKKKSGMTVTYNVEGEKKKKTRKGPRSGLERGVVFKKKRSKGLSLI